MARSRQLSDSTTVKFAGGGSLSLTFKGNLFDLAAEERELIANLSSVIQKYNDRRAVMDPVKVEER